MMDLGRALDIIERARGAIDSSRHYLEVAMRHNQVDQTLADHKED